MKLEMVPIQKGRSQVFVDFPKTAKELFDHNVVYLCGADLTALTLRQKNLLAEYVRRGGGLIVFGGHKALDRAGLRGSLLEEVLPVTGGAGIPPLVSLRSGGLLARGARTPSPNSRSSTPGPFVSICTICRPDRGRRRSSRSMGNRASSWANAARAVWPSSA